jgi:hypothetical protein
MIQTKFLKPLVGVLFALVFFQSCYKDKGNHDIHMPQEPTVAQLDTLYEAIVGDSLIISPKITGIAPADLICNWHILVPEEVDETSNRYEGNSLRIVFGLQAKRYQTRLTVTNKANGMKYFYNFYIQGITQFSKGSLVLSLDNGQTRLSFVKPDGTVQPNIYEVINNEPLPDKPLNIYYATNRFTGYTPQGYWIICENGGVRLKVDNLQKEDVKTGTLHDNFFLAPTNIQVGNIQVAPHGILMGVINNKFYAGTTNTWDQALTYGMFGTYADGNYDLANKFVLLETAPDFNVVAYEKVRKQFVRILPIGSPQFLGTQYVVVGSTVFDPTNVGLELIQMIHVNNTNVYAYMKDSGGQIFELQLNPRIDENRLYNIEAKQKRLFTHPEWITAETKIITTRNGNMYIAYQEKVYRYNPVNGLVQPLTTDFKTKVTMLRLGSDEDTLIVGAGNSIYYCAIATGKDGNLIKQIDGIPGNPIDIAIRN